MQPFCESTTVDEDLSIILLKVGETLQHDFAVLIKGQHYDSEPGSGQCLKGQE